VLYVLDLLRHIEDKAMLVGYARTSTSDQKAGLEAQERDLKAAGCEKVFAEHASASTAQRDQLQATLEFIRDDDTLIITKVDRAARSTADFLGIVEQVRAKGASLVVLSLGGQRMDTSTPTGKLMLTMLAGVTEFERDMMLERQREGIAKAKAEGRYKGRPATVMSQAEKVRGMKESGLSAAQIAQELGIARSGVYRCLAKAKAQNSKN